MPVPKKTESENESLKTQTGSVYMFTLSKIAFIFLSLFLVACIVGVNNPPLTNFSTEEEDTFLRRRSKESDERKTTSLPGNGSTNM